MNELKELPDDKVTVECDITGLEYEVVFKSVSTPVGVREPKKEVIA